MLLTDTIIYTKLYKIKCLPREEYESWISFFSEGAISPNTSCQLLSEKPNCIANTFMLLLTDTITNS
jgi:hypothetical protein